VFVHLAGPARQELQRALAQALRVPCLGGSAVNHSSAPIQPPKASARKADCVSACGSIEACRGCGPDGPGISRCSVATFLGKSPHKNEMWLGKVRSIHLVVWYCQGSRLRCPQSRGSSIGLNALPSVRSRSSRGRGKAALNSGAAVPFFGAAPWFSMAMAGVHQRGFGRRHKQRCRLDPFGQRFFCFHQPPWRLIVVSTWLQHGSIDRTSMARAGVIRGEVIVGAGQEGPIVRPAQGQRDAIHVLDR